MKLKSIIIASLTISASILGSCSGPKGWSVSGTIAGAAGQKVALQAFNNNNWYTIDSINISSGGNFEYDAASPSVYPEVLRLSLDGSNIYFPVDSVSHISVKADAASFSRGYTLEGSEAALRFAEIDAMIADAVASFIADPAGWVTSKILDPVKSMIASVGGGNWGTIVAQLPLKVAQGLVQKAKDAIGSWLGSGTGDTAATAGVGEQYHGAVGGGVEQWRPQVLTVLKMLGQPTSWVDTVLRRMNQESGGNPNAINNWDINAKNGVPSQGLMQTIPPTFAAYAGPFASRPITDPLANIYAGCNYAIHRYGSLAGMNRPGGYALGGIVPTLYDKGGVLNPGRTLVENRTRQPELVLTREQILEYFNAGKDDTRDVQLTFNIPDRSDPWSQAEIWMREAQDIIGR